MNNNLATIRAEKGLTQAELAKKAGISRTIINQLETGAREVTTSKTMLKIARALDAPIADIFLLK